jgi:hypothetical protein
MLGYIWSAYPDTDGSEIGSKSNRTIVRTYVDVEVGESK